MPGEGEASGGESSTKAPPAVGLPAGALEVPVGLQKRLLGQVLGVVVIADPVVGIGVDVSEVGAVEIREGPVELGLRGRLGRGDRLALVCSVAHRAQRRPRYAASRVRSARRSPATHSPASISPSISAARPSRLGASIPAAKIPGRIGQASEALDSVPLIAETVVAAGIDAPSLEGLAALIEGEIDAGEWVAGLRRAERTREAA